MPTFTVGKRVILEADNQYYIVDVVHTDAETCDIHLESDPSVKLYGVPMGGMKIAD